MHLYFQGNHDAKLGFGNFKLYKENRKNTRATVNFSYIASVGAMMLNQCFIGNSSCPSEIVTIPSQNGIDFKIKLHYDVGSMHSLANQHIKPIITNQCLSDFKIELTTITRVTSRKIQIAILQLGNKISLEVLLVNDLKIDSYPMSLPEAWNSYKQQWAERINPDGVATVLDAELLLGSNNAILQPVDVMDPEGNPIETKFA